MKKLQQLLCLLLCLALCAALFPAALAEDAGTIAPAEDPAGEGTIAPATDPEALPPADEPETVYTGTCGENLTWSLDTATGILTITGTGDMFNWSSPMYVPWFGYNGAVNSIVLPDGLTSIGDYAFATDRVSTNVTIPASVTRIGTQAFYGCTLPSITIPEGLTRINSHAFTFSSLKSVYLPASATSIDRTAFEECLELTAIDVAEENTIYSSQGGILYDKNKTTLIQCPGGKTDPAIIPASVTSIFDKAFSRCDVLPSIEVAEENTKYSSQDGILYDKEKTTLICCPGGNSGDATIPASVNYVKNNAFQFCSALNSILFEGSAPTICDYSFFGAEFAVYYPGADTSWTKEIRQNYGGTVTWVPYPNVFTDNAEGKYYYVPVLWAYYHDPQVTKGVDDSHFAPGDTCTRAQVVTFLWRAAGSQEPEMTDNPFTDVAEGKYYYIPVLWAVENGITTGATETTFEPNGDCTRAQVVTFLWRFAGSPEPTTTENPFKDVGTWNYYYKAVLWAAENGITSGTSPTTFAPKETCTRGQIVTFLYRYMEG